MNCGGGFKRRSESGRSPADDREIKPKLVCEVAFAEWTEDEQMRQTTFLSLREDKDPKEVVREV